MGSVRWQTYHDNTDSDNDVVVMDSVHNYGAAAHLLGDGENSFKQRKISRTNRSYRSKMAQKARDERKYKYSLVSVLLIGICLILMVNLGLGIRKCDDIRQEVKTEPTAISCIDESTGRVFPWQKYRLPTTLMPETYHIFLHPNLTTHTYNGKVTIQFGVKEDTDFVIMHSKGHIINVVNLKNLVSSSQEAISPLNIMHCHSSNMISLHFGSGLVKDTRYQLEITFFGNLTFSLGGFYLSKYRKKDGSEKVIATTQFESTDARAAFPCFDEPSFKANFSLSMVRDPNMFTLFNMPLKKTALLKSGLHIDMFPSTVRMSTYLVVFIISDFQNITNYTNSGLKVSVYAAPDKVEHTKLALKLAVDVMEHYEALFKIPFPLPKLDLVAIPDFAAGAMENWGLVTYRETSLLYNPATSAILDQDWVGVVIAHELSHQWFGDLVTMKWWNDLWLNEGFASYMEFEGVNHIRPQWDVMSEIVTSKVLKAMDTDTSHYTHPISVPVTNTRQIQEMFDAISYQKGASLIYMLTDYLENTFFKGVNAYLKKFQYRNAATIDLLNAISKVDNNKHKDLIGMMRTWTIQSGFPVLKISQQGKKIYIEQTRFFYPENGSVSTQSGLWHIPLTYVADHSPTTPTRTLMTSRTKSLDVSQFKWLKFNHNFAGYYRISYDSALWDKLISQMQEDHLVFTTNDRISIVSDAFAMGRVGDLQYSKIFDFIQYMKKEKHYTPVLTTLRNFYYIRHILKFRLEMKEHEAFQLFVIDLLFPLYSASAWKNQSSLTRMQCKLQSLITHSACSFDYQPCIDTAYNHFIEWKNNKTKLSPDMMNTIFQTAVLHGNASDWDYLWNYYRYSIDATLNTKILSALARSHNINRITFLQNELLKGVTIRSQNAARLLISMNANVIGSMLTWKFLKENWDKLTKIHPVAEFTMREIIRSCLSTLLSKAELSSAEAFFKSKKVDNLKSIQRSLEAARIDMYWAVARLPSVTLWLNNHYSRN